MTVLAASLLVVSSVPRLLFQSQTQEAIIDVRRTVGCQDVAYGFEGGSALKDDNDRYWIFTAEMFRPPVDANMRCAIWSSANNSTVFRREGTIVRSNQSFPLVSFEQQCNEQWCPWQGAASGGVAMRLEYRCNPSDLLASPWAPQPIFDDGEQAWHVLLVAYSCDGTHLVTAGTGNVWGARSRVPGRSGIGGPYDVYGIVLGPNATDAAHRWGDAGRGAKYVDQISPFQLPNGTYAAVVGSVATWLATAPRVAGPWTVAPTPLPADVFQRTPRSAYNENPIIRRLHHMSRLAPHLPRPRPAAAAAPAPTDTTDTTIHLNSSSAGLKVESVADAGASSGSGSGSGAGEGGLYVAVFDTVFNEHAGFGVAFSDDGILWSAGADVTLPGGCRTPLGLIEEEGGALTMFFTRRFADCDNQTQQDDCAGFGMASPAMCANIYRASLKLLYT